MPTIFWLEKEFEAPCVHLPLGQVSLASTCLISAWKAEIVSRRPMRDIWRMRG